MTNVNEIIVPKNGYANLINDYMFKRVFGSEECKDILISFLNHVLDDKKVEDVVFLPTEHLGPTEDDRSAVFEIAEFVNFTAEQYREYQKAEKMLYDYYNTLDYARRQGLEQGLQEGLAQGLEQGLEQGLREGLEQGKKEERLDIARRMLEAAMPVGQIVDLTGLSMEEIESL